MNKKIIILIIAGLLTLSACSNNSSNSSQIQGKVINTVNNADKTSANVNNAIDKISDIKKSENIGKSFTVQGKVISTMQTASISGYKIQDPTGSIDISSKNVAQIDTEVTVTGTLVQSRYFGLILKTTD